ncbi:hypothetical protein L1049_021889 [Liquidambar formosana]|uniref:Phytocyanin domain-containing protein n=1 Tax=Liquidambar formosana TaxID=63359 RepID=A0AAP0RBN5_LIQFO
MEKVQVTLFTLAALGCFMMAPVSAFNHVVGGGLGWTVPPNTTFYRDWAKPRTFGAGDKLVFPYRSGVNNVIQVSEKDFNACTQNEAIDMFHDGPTIILLDKPGKYFYYSGVGKHCELGQKLAVTVTNKEGSSGAPFTLDLSSTEITSAAPSPAAILPSKSSATSIRSFGVVSGFLAFLLSLFI